MSFYRLVKQLAIAAGVVGVVLLLLRLQGENGWTLILGLGLPTLALLFWMLADVGYRLAEQRNSANRPDMSAPHNSRETAAGRERQATSAGKS